MEAEQAAAVKRQKKLDEEERKRVRACPHRYRNTPRSADANGLCACVWL